MSYEADIKTTRRPEEALLLLARGLDALAEEIAALRRFDPGMDWSETHGLHAMAEDALTWAEPVPDADEITRQQADRARAIAATQAQLDAATDAEEQRALQAKLRLLKDDGASLDIRPAEGRRAQISRDGTTGKVMLPPVSEERKDARSRWAEQVKLWEYIPLDQPEAVAAFAKGGPMWLYLANRDAVMAMPYGARQWLVQDLEQDSPAEAQEVGRDILKSMDSVDQKVTLEAIDAMSRG